MWIVVEFLQFGFGEIGWEFAVMLVSVLVLDDELDITRGLVETGQVTLFVDESTITGVDRVNSIIIGDLAGSITHVVLGGNGGTTVGDLTGNKTLSTVSWVNTDVSNQYV